MPEETLPSIPGAEPELALDETALSNVPPIAAKRITDTLPASTYAGAATLELTREQEEILDEAVPDDEVDIRPDGLIYVSHEYVRRQLNRAFGRLQWALIPGTPLVADGDDLYQRWVLLVQGTYVSEALASRKFYRNNPGQTRDDVAEAIKSDCLRRCCKDLGVGLIAWNRRFGEQWKRKYARQYIHATPNRGNQTSWRRMDADPFPNEIRMVESPGAAEEKGRGPNNPTPTSAPAAAKTTAASPPPSTPPPVQRVGPRPPLTPPKTDPRAVDATPPQLPNPKPGPRAVPSNKPAAAKNTAGSPPSGGQLKVTDGQIRLLWVRAKGAGLVVGEDAEAWIKWMNTNCLVEIPERHGKKSTEVAVAMMRQLPGGTTFQKHIKALEILATQEGQVEI